jgi:hypothetical protein
VDAIGLLHAATRNPTSAHIITDAIHGHERRLPKGQLTLQRTSPSRSLIRIGIIFRREGLGRNRPLQNAMFRPRSSKVHVTSAKSLHIFSTDAGSSEVLCRLQTTPTSSMLTREFSRPGLIYWQVPPSKASDFD